MKFLIGREINREQTGLPIPSGTTALYIFKGSWYVGVVFNLIYGMHIKLFCTPRKFCIDRFADTPRVTVQQKQEREHRTLHEVQSVLLYKSRVLLQCKGIWRKSLLPLARENMFFLRISIGKGITFSLGFHRTLLWESVGRVKKSRESITG